jgi:hypothetical protein
MNVNPVVILGFIAVVVLIAIAGVMLLERLRPGRGKQPSSHVRASAAAVAIASVASSAGTGAASSCGGASGGGSYA